MDGAPGIRPLNDNGGGNRKALLQSKAFGAATNQKALPAENAQHPGLFNGFERFG